METWDALLARRQVREYAEAPVERELLDRVLEAARRSPSARNAQRFDLVVLTDPAVKADLADTWQGAQWTPNAPVVIALVAPVIDDEWQKLSVEYDLGQVATAILVMATDLGLASGQSSCRDQDLARSILGLPADRYCSKLLTVGHPAQGSLAPVRRPDRRPVDEVVHWGRW